jgi:hypothetical protein
MLHTIVRSVVACWVPIVLGGCGAYDSVKDAIEDEGKASSEAPGDPPDPIEPDPDPPAATPTAAPAEPPPPAAAPSSESVPEDLSGVEFLHSDVSDWQVTSSLHVSIGGGTIRLDYDKARTWRAVNGVNANPWIFVFRDGHWYAATFEWLKFGQTTKPIHTVAGDHIKRRPLHDFQPRSGEVYGFMVSGLARDDTRNVHERTPVVMVRWP